MNIVHIHIALSLIILASGTREATSVCILRRTWSLSRKTMPLRFLCSIAWVPLVKSVTCVKALLIETNCEGFLAGPSVKRSGALNAGLRLYASPLS